MICIQAREKTYKHVKTETNVLYIKGIYELKNKDFKVLDIVCDDEKTY